MTRDKIYDIALMRITDMLIQTGRTPHGCASKIADELAGILLATPQAEQQEYAENGRCVGVKDEGYEPFIRDAQGIHDRRCNAAAAECERLAETDMDRNRRDWVAIFCAALPECRFQDSPDPEAAAIVADSGLLEILKRIPQTKETK